MRVLLVVHGFPPAASAGTEVYTRNLARALAACGDEVFVITREADPARPEYSVRRTADGALRVAWINNTFQACTSFEDSYANPALLRQVEGEIEAIAPDVVHVQHLTCLSTGIPGAAARRRIPVVMTLNDYWLICHRGQLVDRDGRRCDGPFGRGCERCVPGAALLRHTARAGALVRARSVPGMATVAGVGLALLEAAAPAGWNRSATLERLGHMLDAVTDVGVFLAPSKTLHDRFLRFGLPSDRLRRCEQGIELRAFASTRRQPAEVLRLGFIGGLIPSKAPHLLLEAAGRLPAGSVTVDVLGSPGAFHGDDRYARRLAPLLAQRFVRRLGEVPHERIPAALAEVDALVVPSVWVENAPFVIREAFASGAPVVAASLGGMAEMVRHGEDGLLFEPGDASSLASALDRLITEPGLLARLRTGIRPPLSIEEDAAALRGTYLELRAPSGAGTVRRDRTAAAAPAAPSAIVLNYETADQTWLAVRSLQTSLSRPRGIYVVDNGSGDDSARRLRSALSGVEVMETGRNLGFSGGCNVGIAKALAAGADFVLLMNSDAVLRPDALTILLDAAGHDGVGIVAPLLLSREEPDCVASAGILFSTSTGRMRHRGAGQRPASVGLAQLCDVDAVSGCVMLVRAGVFHAVGLLDEDCFFSFEDIDFCLRARRAGFRVLCAAGAIAYHEGGRSIGRRSPRRVYYATRNHLRVSMRCAPSGPVVSALRAGAIVGLNAAYAVRSPDVPLLSGLAAVARGTWHHLLGRYGPA